MEYSDGSYEKMDVTWDTGSGINLDNLAPGTYDINGTVNREIYNSPLAKYRADPYIAYNRDEGMYYLTGSNLNEGEMPMNHLYSGVLIPLMG